MMVNSFRTPAAISAAAAVVAALTLVAAPTAHADQVGGICTGLGGKWAIWYNNALGPGSGANNINNYAPCGANRQIVLSFSNCGALAYDGTNFGAAEGATKDDAVSAAYSKLPGSSIVTSACNDGGPPGSMSGKAG
jgi:hypothetical protein